VEAGVGFGSEVDRRREAIRFVVEDGGGKADAGRRVGRSRQWVNKWLRRYREHGEAGLVDRSRVPKQQPTKTPVSVVAKVLEIRQSLVDDPVASIGALTILSELEREGFTPIPSLRTIDRILNAAGVTRQWTRHERSGNKLPLPEVTAPGVWQQADWIQDRWLEGGIKFNSLQIGDVGSHGITAGQYLDRKLLTAVRFLIEYAWPFLSIPYAMGTDNAFTSTTHPNNPFTIWTRICLFFGVEVVIGPPGDFGWTNHVEAVNNEWQRKTIWVQHFDSLDDVRAGSNRAVEWLNTRRAVLDPDLCGTRYPAEYIAANADTLRWLPPINIDDHLDRRHNLNIPLAAGRITFIRHVDEHHTIGVAGNHWPVSETIPVGGLVTATITTADHRLKIRHHGEPAATFDYPIPHTTINPYYPPTEQSLLHHV
jgi:transposase